MKDKKQTEAIALLQKNYGNTDVVKVPPYEQEPIISSQSFLEAGGTVAHPGLNLEGMIEITLPEKIQKEVSIATKKEVLGKLLIEEAKKKGCTHVFYRHFSSDYNTIVADGYRKKESDPENKGLVEQFEEWIIKNEIRGWLEKYGGGDWFDGLHE